jgi:butyrate kinase
MNSTPSIFVINPGSTSTKIALFTGHRRRFDVEVKHDAAELGKCPTIIAQDHVRREALLKALVDQSVPPRSIDIFIARGGLLRPVPEGIYEVNQTMLDDLKSCKYGQHASNLGAILADEMAGACGKKAYIANPVVVDELSDAARIGGHPDIPRRSIFHALSQKAAARKVAAKLGKPYRKCNLIVAHMGGGVTIGAHRKGRVIDVNNGLDGEGPFTPERTGALPLLPFFRWATERNLTLQQVYKIVTRNGGLLAHLGTNDCRVIEDKAAAGEGKFPLVYDAFIYGVAKQIGAMAATLEGKVDAIVLTGGVVRGPLFVKKLKKFVSFIAPVHLVIENSEMTALAAAAMDMHEGIQKASEY